MIFFRFFLEIFISDWVINKITNLLFDLKLRYNADYTGNFLDFIYLNIVFYILLWKNKDLKENFLFIKNYDYQLPEEYQDI